MDKEPTSYTYADLRRDHISRLEKEDKSLQQVRNHTSALTQYATVLGRSDACQCARDFVEHLESNLTLFQEGLKAKGVSSASIANKVSYIRAIKSTVNTMLTGISQGRSFADALRVLFKDGELSVYHECNKIGVAARTVLDWMNGAIPRRPREVAKLEQYFNLAPKALTGMIDFGVTRSNPVPLKSREIQQRLKEDVYRYKIVSNRIRHEWAGLLNFYTAPYLLGKMQRNSTWRVKPVEQIGSPRLICWASTTPTGICPTGQIAWGYVSSYLGYLILDKARGGAGMSGELLSLALLSDSSLVLGYTEFRRNRSGVYTESINKTLVFIIALLREETGYLRQKSEFRTCLPIPVDEKDWDTWCETNRNVLDGVYRDLKKGQHIKRVRDPKEPIAAILAEEHPIHTLIKMTEAMSRRFILDQCITMRATSKRDLLLVKMLISNPLRVHHFAIMTYRPDNTGNLYQDSYGAWRLRFNPSDFKNQKGAASKEYDVTLSPWLYDDIVEYLTVHRPLMRFAHESEYVFLQNSKQGKRRYWETIMISTRILRITRAFIPDCPGFGAHAFRHIVATDFIKNNPNGYQVAANILHDKLETVLREYAHVKVADGFAHWTNYFDSQVEAVKGASHE